MSQLIDMFCWFDVNGRPYPLKFRWINPEGLQKIIKIIKVERYQLEKIGGNPAYVFVCQTTHENERIKEVEIKYLIDHCQWILSKSYG